MKKLVLILFMVGCGVKPLVPETITVDAPEKITVEHKITWEFVDEYCNNVSTSNNELEECFKSFIDRFDHLLN